MRTKTTAWLLALMGATGSLPAAEPEQAGAAAPPAAVATDWILDRLARPAPMRTAFVELRESRLLRQPLRLSGEYRRPQDDVLVREVRAPYSETTTIRAGEATIARDGKSRTFSLSRAPELEGLQASFGALLSGDRERLDTYYTLSSEGTRQDWTLTLVPRGAELAGQVRDIVLHGRGAELRCIETRAAGATEPQRTLLASAAAAAAGIDGTDDGGDGFAALCHGGSAAD
jgi:hypothetical protein